MSQSAVNKLGICSIVAGLAQPVSFVAMVLGMTYFKLVSGNDSIAMGPPGSVGFPFAAILAIAMFVSPFAAVVLGACSIRTIPGRIGLALGVLGGLLTLGVVVFGMLAAAGVFTGR